MTVKLSSLKADLKREEEGDWIDYPDWPGVAFKVSSLLKPRYVTARDLLLQRLQRTHKNKPVPSDVMMVEMGKLFHEHILQDWRGLDVGYDRDTAKEVMSSAEYRPVIAAVQWCAAKLSDVDIEFMEGEEKN